MQSNYLYNYGIIREYTPNYHKLVVLNCIRNNSIPPHKFTLKGKAGNNSKLENNLCRARSNLFELVMCNEFNLFVTLTLNPQKYDRYNLEKFRKDLSQFIRDYRKKYCLSNLRYLFIPEEHKNGAWHIHGFLMGLPLEHLQCFVLSDNLPFYIRKKLLLGSSVYDWLDYSKKFGYCVIEPVINKEAVSKYVTKYITKNLYNSSIAFNHHLFYASHGLKRSKVMYRGVLCKSVENPNYSNRYVSVIIDTIDRLKDYLNIGVCNDNTRSYNGLLDRTENTWQFFKNNRILCSCT